MMLKCGLILLLLLQLPAVFAQNDDELRNKMLVQYSLRDYPGAMESCDQMIRVHPTNGEAYEYRGLAKLLMGDTPGAHDDMELAKKNGSGSRAKDLRYVLDEKAKLKYLKKFFYKRETLYPELGYRPKYTRKDTLRGALRPERTCFDVTFYDLKVKIDPKSKTISGNSGITFRVVEATQKIQIDLFDNYTITAIEWNNKELPYTREFNAVFVLFPEVLKVGSMNTIHVTYSGKPRNAPNPPWDGGFVWKKDKKRNLWCGVACEHLGASSWWPTKDHPSDEPDSALLTFTVPEGYDVVSNGRFRSKTNAGKGYESHTWFVGNPINNYNITFYLGKFAEFQDTITNPSGKYLSEYYVLPFHLADAKKCFAQTKEVLEFYDEAFGDYPFMNDKFALIESPFEGMEHQGAIAYGNEFNKKGKNQAYIDKKYDYIIVHESAHEWWGNSVTARDMADIWIQEGFATYAEMMFIENKDGQATYLKEMSRKMMQIFNVWPLVQNYNVNENAFASNDCYTKGAVVLHNLRCTINNDSLFFKLIKDFALRYKRKTVTSSDFVSMVSEYTERNYRPFFKKFLYDKDPPVLKYGYKHEGNNLYLKFWWEGVDKGFEMPVCILSGEKSFRLTGTTDPQTIVLKNAATFRFLNQWIGPEKVEKNSFTYYWTRLTDW
jgi:aminopeptidase N